MDRKLIRELVSATEGETTMEYMLDEFREIRNTDVTIPDILCTPEIDKDFEEFYAKAKELDTLMQHILHRLYEARMKLMKQMEASK